MLPPPLRMDVEMSWKKGVKFLRTVKGPGELFKLALPQHLRGRHILNEGAPDPGGPTTGGDVVRALRAQRNQLKGEAYVDSGAVDYKRLGGSQAYAELERLSRALIHVDPQDLDGDAARLSFFINLYNVLMIHGVIALGIEKSVMERPSFFTTVAYRVGDTLLTPDEIEHGILRLNEAHPSSGTVYFEADDPRRAWAPSALDPRIHLALVCVAQSCPPIGFYSVERIDEELDLASLNYVNGGVRVDHERRVVELPAIFSWYEVDFGGREGLWAFLQKYADEPLAQELARAHAEGYPWEVLEYDWALNTL